MATDVTIMYGPSWTMGKQTFKVIKFSCDLGYIKKEGLTAAVINIHKWKYNDINPDAVALLCVMSLQNW